MLSSSLKQGVTRLIVFRIRQFPNMDDLIVRDGAKMNRGSRLSVELGFAQHIVFSLSNGSFRDLSRYQRGAGSHLKPSLRRRGHCHNQQIDSTQELDVSRKILALLPDWVF